MDQRVDGRSRTQEETGGAPLDKPIAWKRRIGGRSGVTVTLPRGCYSDDTQLRLATGRAIRSDGFDVEAFAKVELPLWLSYGLGGGKSTVPLPRSSAERTGVVEQQVQGMDAFRRQRRERCVFSRTCGRADAFGSGKLPAAMSYATRSARIPTRRDSWARFSTRSAWRMQRGSGTRRRPPISGRSSGPPTACRKSSRAIPSWDIGESPSSRKRGTSTNPGRRQ